MDTYLVRPRPGTADCELTGPSLPYPIRFRDSSNAANYAHCRMKFRGGRVVVLDSRGHPIITEHSAPQADDGLRILLNWSPRAE